MSANAGKTCWKTQDGYRCHLSIGHPGDHLIGRMSVPQTDDDALRGVVARAALARDVPRPRTFDDYVLAVIASRWMAPRSGEDGLLLVESARRLAAAVCGVAGHADPGGDLRRCLRCLESLGGPP